MLLCNFHYASPLLFGELYDPDLHRVIEIDSKIYIFFIFLTLLTVAFSMNSNLIKIPSKPNNYNMNINNS